MTELQNRVAKALREKAAEIDQRPGVHEADPMWFADEYARAAIEAMRDELPRCSECGVKFITASRHAGKPTGEEER